MSAARAEKALIQHLLDRDSLAILETEGLPLECIPTEELQEVYQWVLAVWDRGGRSFPPSVDAIREEWGERLEVYEIPVDEEPEDSIESVIDVLKARYIERELQDKVQEFAIELTKGVTEEKVASAQSFASVLFSKTLALASKREVTNLKGELDTAMYRLQAGEEESHGLKFGMPLIDDYTFGIHPGELAILVAPAKVGKSFMLDYVALKAWEAGGNPVLFTLENSIEMTVNRIISMATGIELNALQQGQLDDDDMEKVEEFRERFADSDRPLHIIHEDRPTIASIVSRARILEADSIIIDQLSWMGQEGDSRMPAHMRWAMTVRGLAQLIKGRDPIPCLMAHQINRDGIKASERSGALSLTSSADTSEIERAADWLFGLFRTKDDESNLTARFQTIAARRRESRNFQLRWQVDVGYIHAISEFDMETGLPIQGGVR